MSIVAKALMTVMGGVAMGMPASAGSVMMMGHKTVNKRRQEIATQQNRPNRAPGASSHRFLFWPIDHFTAFESDFPVFVDPNVDLGAARSVLMPGIFGHA